MQFGFTLKPDHTIERTLALTRQAEAAGFGYGWLFDSHVLWREPYPLLTLMAQATETPAPGHVRHQPGDPRADRHRVARWPPSTRSPAAAWTWASGGATRPAACWASRRPRWRTLEEAVQRHPRPGRGPAASSTRARARPALDRAVDAAGLGRRVRARGAGDDRAGGGRGHPPAGRPGPHPLVRLPGARGPPPGRPRPGRRQGPGGGAGARGRRWTGRERTRWFPALVSQPRRGPRQQVPARAAAAGADRLHPRSRGLRLPPPRRGRVVQRRASWRRGRRTGSASSAPRTSTSPSSASWRTPAWTSSTST